MTDLTPEALDALEKRLRRTLLYEGSGEGSDLPEEAADTIAALRAAPVAMRERAAQVAENRHKVWQDGDGIADAEGLPAVSCDVTACENIAAAIRALPLDAPAPVDPVAEAARVLQRWRDKRIADALDKSGPGAAIEIAHESSMEMLARALAQETSHDRP